MSGHNENQLESKKAERYERAKKIYRYVNDVARRLSEATTESRNVSDLFNSVIETQRQKLRDNCEKLFFLDIINYGKKSLELLWRKVYYDTISTAKKLRESNSDYDNYIFTHITCGIGHFHNFITRVQSDMNIELKDLDYLPLYKDDDWEENSKTSDEEYQLGKSIIYTCLIYLGDLCRYQVEIFNSFGSSTAVRYYLQAAQLDMSSGMPYNQLGNLYLSKNYNLDSVCYYIHCLCTISPFEGALGNLTKIFEKNTETCDLLNKADSMNQPEHIQAMISNFLSLIEIWYFDKNDSNVPEIWGTMALQLKIAMDFIKIPLPDKNKDYSAYMQAVEEENLNPSFVNSSIIHNMVKICLFTLLKLNDHNEAKAFACKAFTLAFLSQLLQKLVEQLKLMGLKGPVNTYDAKYTSDYSENNHTVKVTDESSKDEIVTNGIKDSVLNGTTSKEVTPEKEDKTDITMNGDSKNTKKTQPKRRRRCRVASSDSSDLSDLDADNSNIESDKSYSDDDDDLSDSTCLSDDDSKSDESPSDGCEPEDFNGHIGDATIEEVKNANTDQVECNGINSKETENMEKIVSDVNSNKLNIIAFQDFITGDNYLPSIKILQDWALTEKDLIISCAEGESFYQCVVDLLNIFMYYFNSKGIDLNLDDNERKIFNQVRNTIKKLNLEYKTIPLPEDINLRGTNICKFDKDAAEWHTMVKYKTNPVEENVIRILHFIDFGHHVAKIIPRIRYNRSMKIFYLKKIMLPKVNTKLNHKRSREWHSKKQAEPTEGGLLRRLGHLWLASQVKELERTGQADMPSFVAVDTAVLHEHLRQLKHILAARNFTILIPAVVLQELDELKRERSSARNAIRWLEMQLKSSSRFLRTQRPGQSKPLPLLKYPRKAPQHVHNFIQILEFCNHFVADDKQLQGGNGDPDSLLHSKATPFLILLVGNESGKSEEIYKEFSLTGAAQTAGISVECIGDFYTKWRQSLLKSGKKR